MIHKAGQKLVYPKEYAVVQQNSPAAWWSGAYVAYDAKNAASYAASLLDLTGNGRHATTGVQPGWANGTGWTFTDSSGHYLVTPIYPVCDQTWSAIVKFTNTSVQSYACVFGLWQNASFTNVFVAWMQQGGNTTRIDHGGGLIAEVVTPYMTTGTVGFAGRKLYRNGIHNNTLGVGVGSLATIPILIGALNRYGAPSYYHKGVVSSWAIYDTTRSDAQMLATSAAMP